METSDIKCGSDITMTDIKKTAFVLRLPEAFVEKVDARAKELGISRNQWFTNMTRWALYEKDKR